MSAYALILDDHPLVARGVAEFLRARLPQLEVVVAGGADDLLRWVDERGTPAIALIDFWLAEGAAVSLVAQVRSLCPGTPIAVISGARRGLLRSGRYATFSITKFSDAATTQAMMAAIKSMSQPGR